MAPRTCFLVLSFGSIAPQISELRGVKNRLFPLTRHIAYTTACSYRSSCDTIDTSNDRHCECNVQDDADQSEPANSSSSSPSTWSHINGDITLSTSSRRQLIISSPHPQSTSAGTLHDLKKRRSRDLQLRLFGCTTSTNGGGVTSADFHPSLTVAEIYGHSNGSQRQNRLVRAAISCEQCCRLM